MRHFVTHFLIAAFLALTLGYGVAVAAGPYNCYMVACGCTWRAIDCEYCHFEYSGGECTTYRVNCEAFIMECPQ